LILRIRELIEFTSSFYTLDPGDDLMTGTPDGVGPISPRDASRVSISGIGEIDVYVRNSCDSIRDVIDAIYVGEHSKEGL
jgi:2-keto-4-pentenoate hydratase/2-oxohepta-3-ene-1,7-dioic acid hydratase in catechol pathway